MPFGVGGIKPLLKYQSLLNCLVSHMKLINTLCGQNTELLVVKPRGKYKYVVLYDLSNCAVILSVT
jgi:hypothetical protein